MYQERNKNLCVFQRKNISGRGAITQGLSCQVRNWVLSPRVECTGCFGALSVTVVCKWQENRKAGDRVICKTVSVRQESEQGKLQKWGKWHRCAWEHEIYYYTGNNISLLRGPNGCLSKLHLECITGAKNDRSLRKCCIINIQNGTEN